MTARAHRGAWDEPGGPLQDAAMGSAADARESEQDRVYRFLSAQTEPVALARIIVELGIKRWTVTCILHRLLKRGSIEHPGRDAWQIRSAG